MSDFRIEWNDSAIPEILKSSAAVGVVTSLAEGIAARAGEGFEVEVPSPHTRARAQVVAVTYEAKRASAKDNVLARAVS